MASDHRSLYRAYRPQTFADVVGQHHITETLGHAVAADRVHHAYLFTGPRGTGKTSTARILAKALNCAQGPTATPCGTCQPCTDIADGSHVDVVEIDAASHGGVDDVRDLRDRVAFAPAQARTKVYIVDECHMLSTAGWNAFLRTVEEPPDHVLFVFATTEPHKVLDTITSRTQRFDFRRVSQAALAAHVDDVAAREGLTLDPVARDLVVRAGDGSVRDTLSVLDQVRAFVGDDIGAEAVAEVLGTVGANELGELARGIAAGDVAGLCALVGRLADSGVDLRQLARDAVEHLRRLLLLRAAPDTDLLGLGEDTSRELADQAAGLGTAELLRAVELLAEAQAAMRRGNIRLPLEIALIKGALPEAAGDAGALAARVERLERGAGGQPGTGPAAAAEAAAPAADGSRAAASTSAGAADPAAPTDEPVQPARPAGDPAREPAQPTGDGPASQAPIEDPGPTPPAEDPAQEPAPPGGGPAERPAAGEEPPDPALAGEAPDQPAAAASGPPSGELTLERVQARWGEVLEGVKARKRSVHPWFATGSPTTLSAKVLTVSFGRQYAAHVEQLTHERVQEAVGDAVEEVLEVRLLVRARVLDHDTEEPAVLTDDEDDVGAPGDAAPAASAAPAAGDPPAADDATASNDGGPDAAGAAAAGTEAAPPDGAATDAGDEHQAHREAVERLQRELGARPLGDADAGGR